MENRFLKHDRSRLTQILELAVKDLETVTVIVFCIFKKLREETEDIFKNPNQTSSCAICYEK